MLKLTRLTGPQFALNPDLIERAEATPDTVVTLINGSKYVVRESVDELIDLVREYRADVVVAAQHCATAPATPGQPTGNVARHAGRGTVVFLHSEPGEQ